MNASTPGQPVHPIHPATPVRPVAGIATSAPAPATAAPAPAAAPAAATTEATPAEPKVKKTRAKKEGSVSRPRMAKFADTDIISLFRPNAKSRNSGARFNEYRHGMTVKEYVDLIKTKFNRSEGQIYADFRWDLDRNLIHIGPTVVEPPPAPPAPEPKPKATKPTAVPATPTTP